jgi:predicted HNH restriction endonuclease
MERIYINYKTLVFEKNQAEEYITYSDKLMTTEWQEKRSQIIARDKEQCTVCNVRQSKYVNGKAYINRTKEEIAEMRKNVKEKLKDYMHQMGMTFPIPEKIEIKMHIDYHPTFLHVHHKYYIKDKLPWEYPSDALTSLCKNCHQEIHDKEKIPVYLNDLMKIELDFKNCGKCNGSGYLRQYHYYMNGICFECNGNEFEDNL